MRNARKCYEIYVGNEADQGTKANDKTEIKRRDLELNGGWTKAVASFSIALYTAKAKQVSSNN